MRPLSTDYEAGPSSSPFLLPPQGDFAPMNATSTVGFGPAQTASTTSFESHLVPTTHAYSPYESSWNTPLYDPPPPANMTWNVPAWAPSIEHSPRLAPRPDHFHFSPPLGVAQPFFEQTPSPYHHPRQLVPNGGHYALSPAYEHYNGSQSQMAGIPSVSLPTPSSYFQGHFPGPH